MTSLAAPSPLLAVLDSAGEPQALEGGRRLPLDQPDRAWLVEGGAVDIHARQRDGGGMRDFLFQVPAGGLLFGGEAHPDLALMAMAGPDVRLHPLSLPGAGLSTEAARVLAPKVDDWIKGLAAALARAVVPRDRPQRGLAGGERLERAGEQTLVARQGVVWARLELGRGRFVDLVEVFAGGMVPLTQSCWLRPGEDAALRGYSTVALLRAAGWSRRVSSANRLAAQVLAHDFGGRAEREARRLTERAE
ncbi:MAG: hypothetical protein HQL41_15725, partial [Alphaproteobacteria bacterium]|nr:hypothetical protein [Alphaproteobacteria bacterium]